MTSRTIIERLVYVKYLHHIAQEISKRKSSVSISLSLVILDNSIENFLWIIINDKRPESVNKVSDSFVKLANEVEDVCAQAKLPIDKNTIIRIHKARNDVQHNGILLDKNQVGQFFDSTRDLLALSSNLFNVKWNDVSLSMLIEHPKISQLYREAELAYNNANYREAVNKTIMSFELAKNNRQANQFGSGVSLYKYPILETLLNLSKKKEGDQSVKQLSAYLNIIYAELEVLKLGLDYKKWRDYRLPLGSLDPDKDFTKPLFPDSSSKLIPLKTEPQNKDIVLLTLSDEELKEWLEDAMPFALQSILQWQETAGLYDMDMLNTSPP